MNFNILGIGLPQLIIVFAIALIVFGPKKMIEWAYMAGKYTAKMRAMFQSTMNEFQKEMAESGVDLKDLTKDLPDLSASQFNILNEAQKVVDSAAAKPTPKVASSEPTPPPVTPPSPTDDQEPKYDAWLPK